MPLITRAREGKEVEYKKAEMAEEKSFLRKALLEKGLTTYDMFTK